MFIFRWFLLMELSWLMEGLSISCAMLDRLGVENQDKYF